MGQATLEAWAGGSITLAPTNNKVLVWWTNRRVQSIYAQSAGLTMTMQAADSYPNMPWGKAVYVVNPADSGQSFTLRDAGTWSLVLAPGQTCIVSRVKFSGNAQWWPTVYNQIASDTSWWTTFTPSVDTVIVYVSDSDGNDADSGLTQALAKKTIAAGIALLRHGYPDWLLLKRGDTFANQSFGQWKKSGRSLFEPMLIGTYGTGARPLVQTGTGYGIRTFNGGGSPATIDHIAISGIDLHAHTSVGDAIGAPCVGIDWLQPATNILIEDCRIRGYNTNIVLTGVTAGGEGIWNARLRRNVVLDAFGVTVGSDDPFNGLYCYNCHGLLLEENVFDHNGWHETISGAGANVKSHNVYIDNGCFDVVTRGNVIARGAAHGMQLRPGGIVEGNLFLRNGLGLQVGGGNIPTPDGVDCLVTNNGFVEAADISPSALRGWCFNFSNIRSGVVQGNIAVTSAPSTDPHMAKLEGNDNGDASEPCPIKNLQFIGNKWYGWGGSFVVEGPSTSRIENITFTGNDVQDTVSPWALIQHEFSSQHAQFHSQNNRFWSTAASNAWFQTAGVNQSLATWKALVGDTSSVALNVGSAPALGMTVNAFIAGARAQLGPNWDLTYSAASGYENLSA